jgi:hypothetical protein
VSSEVAGLWRLSWPVVVARKEGVVVAGELFFPSWPGRGSKGAAESFANLFFLIGYWCCSRCSGSWPCSSWLPWWWRECRIWCGEVSGCLQRSISLADYGRQQPSSHRTHRVKGSRSVTTLARCVRVSSAVLQVVCPWWRRYSPPSEPHRRSGGGGG